MSDLDPAVRINAKMFQEPLGELAATMSQKVIREGRNHIPGPTYIGEDIGMLIRYAGSVYNLLNYLNADERRKDDCDWHVRYGVTGMSLVRSLIDCLYNVTAILEDPPMKGVAYRTSGFRRALNDLDEDYTEYRGRKDWEAWIEERRKVLKEFIGQSELTIEDIMAQPMWPTFGTYIRARQPDGNLSANQKFLKTFAHLEWRQYSALSHGALEAFIGTLGVVPVGAYFMDDFIPRADRDKLAETYHLFLSDHIGRSASILLCILTEIQCYCRFDGANINDRLCKIWRALLPFPAAREFYDGRYGGLMREKGVVVPSNECLLTVDEVDSGAG